MNTDERATQLLQDRQRLSADLIAQRTDAQRKHSLTVQSIHQHWQPLLHQSAPANSVNAPTAAAAIASPSSLSTPSSDIRDKNAI